VNKSGPNFFVFVRQ